MIALERVTRCYGEVTAVREATLRIQDGSITVIFGPSGCGKTTLLRLVAGLEVPDEGTIHLDGELVSTSSWVVAPHRRDIGVVFQDPALWPHMTVGENIGFGLSGLEPGQRCARVRHLLEVVSLEGFAERHPSQLSGGEARRVALARALAPQPARLLMDEPLAHLDTALKLELLPTIRDTVKETGATLVYVTHDIEEARALSAEVIHMEAGQLVSDGQ